MKKSVKIELDVWKVAKKAATDQNITIEQLVTDALKAYKEKLDKENKQ